MESFWQGDAHGAFNHARTGKTNERFGLGDHHIAHEGKTCGHAAHGRVGQDADVRQAFLRQAGEGGIGFGHLHERQQALLHAGATSGGEANERHFLLDGGVHAAHKTLADHRAHRAAHEVEFKASGHHIDAVHRAAHHHQGVGLAGVFQGFFQAFGVFAAVLEFQGVHRQDFLANLVAAFRVQERIQAGPR